MGVNLALDMDSTWFVMGMHLDLSMTETYIYLRELSVCKGILIELDFFHRERSKYTDGQMLLLWSDLQCYLSPT